MPETGMGSNDKPSLSSLPVCVTHQINEADFSHD